MQRVDEDGNLSLEPYPSAIGDEKTNPWITNDFLETMAEMVTPSAQHSLDAMHYLYVINNTLRSALAPGELLWPLSMPPRLPKDKTKLRLAKMGPKKEAYLKEWAKRHGYSQGTPCGAHINLSIDQHIIELVLNAFPERFNSEREVRNYLYTILAQGFVRYRWLLTYLYGASPIVEENYFEQGKTIHFPAIRTCIKGKAGIRREKTMKNFMKNIPGQIAGIFTVMTICFTIISFALDVKTIPVTRLAELFLLSVPGGIWMEFSFGTCFIKKMADAKRACIFVVPFAAVTFICGVIFRWITELTRIGTYIKFVGIFLVCLGISILLFELEHRIRGKKYTEKLKEYQKGGKCNES